MSVCGSKEEAVRLQKNMEKQLEETNSQWDEERRTMAHHADQAKKVSAGLPGDHSLNYTSKLLLSTLFMTPKISCIFLFFCQHTAYIQGVVKFHFSHHMEWIVRVCCSILNPRQKLLP